MPKRETSSRSTCEVFSNMRVNVCSYLRLWGVAMCLAGLLHDQRFEKPATSNLGEVVIRR